MVPTWVKQSNVGGSQYVPVRDMPPSGPSCEQFTRLPATPKGSGEGQSRNVNLNKES
jgi:hypothetical protein